MYFTHLKCYRKLEENFLLPKMKVIKYWKSKKIGKVSEVFDRNVKLCFHLY